jgi:hypothetical protein
MRRFNEEENRNMKRNPPHNRLRHHVTGTIERREAKPVVERRAKQQPTERDVDDFVRREVLCCLSGLVSTLAEGMDEPVTAKPLRELCELAFELSTPVDDWEEAATQRGWRLDYPGDKHGAYWKGTAAGQVGGYQTAEECVRHDEGNAAEPYQWEVFEHWAVTPYFADKLEAHGEKVEKDFFGLCVWARTTTGQGISCDGVVKRIVAEAFNARL